VTGKPSRSGPHTGSCNVARSLSDTFAGIAPADVPGFVVAQLLGAGAAALLARWLFAET
jgi:glycerol uptake facilitator-like aquaporin